MLTKAVDVALIDDDFEAAGQLIEIGNGASESMRYPRWDAVSKIRQRRLDAQAKAYPAVEPALEILHRDPAAPQIAVADGWLDIAARLPAFALDAELRTHDWDVRALSFATIPAQRKHAEDQIKELIPLVTGERETPKCGWRLVTAFRTAPPHPAGWPAETTEPNSSKMSPGSALC